MDVEMIVAQGGTWGSLTCSNHIDSIGRRLFQDQKMCFENCSVLKGSIPIQIVCAYVPSSLVNTLLNIDKFREEANY